MAGKMKLPIGSRSAAMLQLKIRKLRNLPKATYRLKKEGTGCMLSNGQPLIIDLSVTDY